MVMRAWPVRKRVDPESMVWAEVPLLERMQGEEMIRPAVSKTYPLPEAPRDRSETTRMPDFTEGKILGKAALEIG
jgi:hypothetical protein